ncbi:MAG: YdcF family protein [Bacteroidales bacterium]|nr:YdcF family protein [Bacteroidales bacterium]
MSRFALMRKKERYTATWLGNLLKLVFLLLIFFIIFKTIHPFLAITKTVNSDILVVEGFVTDYALEESAEIFENGNYRLLIITGKKRMKGAHLDQYENDGEYSAASLIKTGFDSTKISVVAVDHRINRDRTYASAVAVRQWMEASGMKETSFNLVTLGCHARRSRLLFEEAFPKKFQVGIIAIPDRSYDAERWWTSSNGFREVTKETIAWIYARFFFFPGENE